MTTGRSCPRPNWKPSKTPSSRPPRRRLPVISPAPTLCPRESGLMRWMPSPRGLLASLTPVCATLPVDPRQPVPGRASAKQWLLIPGDDTAPSAVSCWRIRRCQALEPRRCRTACGLDTCYTRGGIPILRQNSPRNAWPALTAHRAQPAPRHRCGNHKEPRAANGFGGNLDCTRSCSFL